MLVSFLRTMFFGGLAALSLDATASRPAQAQSYPIDCAILLCLSGGWPASVPCTRARAEFIRRITPWPVEPPLQIWRCPMGASYRPAPHAPSAARLWDALAGSEPSRRQSFPIRETSVQMPGLVTREAFRPDEETSKTEQIAEELLRLVEDLRDGAGRADIDISGSAFDFVRSIRVFMVSGRQRETGPQGDHDCERESSVRMGRYGVQGDYAWHRSSMAEVPPAFDIPFGWGDWCPNIRFRAVFVDWRDYKGTYGWERVDY